MELLIPIIAAFIGAIIGMLIQLRLSIFPIKKVESGIISKTTNLEEQTTIDIKTVLGFIYYIGYRNKKNFFFYSFSLDKLKEKVKKSGNHYISYKDAGYPL